METGEILVGFLMGLLAVAVAVVLFSLGAISVNESVKSGKPFELEYEIYKCEILKEPNP